MTFFGQLVIGPPGCGKTTYCWGMQQFLEGTGRNCAVVNLDFANELCVPYDTDLDVNELMSTSRVMDQYSLGPNGALMYCMEYLEKNADWLIDRVRRKKGKYILIDCPGQTELYCQHPSLRNVLLRLQKELDLRLTCVHLVDSVLCTNFFNYLGALMVSLNAQTFLELPHVNVLAKVDILTANRMKLDHRIGRYASGDNLEQMALFGAEEDKHPFDERFEAFTREICDVLEGFGMLSFRLLNIQDDLAIRELIEEIDRANGYAILPRHLRVQDPITSAIDDYLNPEA